MRTLLYLISSLLVTSSIFGQETKKEEEIVFSFASRSTEASQGLSASTDTTKYPRMLRIYNQLIAARGDFRDPAPDLVLQREPSDVAWMNYNTMQIGLGERAYDECMKFGPDADAALAFLLGHELVHFYEKHAWQRNFANKYSDLEVGKKLKSGLTDALANETQADYLGGFLAHSAGFPVFNKGPELTANLYKAYNLKDSLLTKYPALSERQELNKRSAQLMEKLVNIYEMANLLTLIGDYRAAAEYYQYVLKEYQSREILNNAGVMTARAAMQYFSDAEMAYVLPLEIDLNSLGARGKTDSLTREMLLSEALRHLDGAIAMDPDYAPAYLNKACVYVLLRDYARADYYARIEALQAVARQPKHAKTATDAQVLLAILEALKGSKNKAEEMLLPLSASSKIASINLAKVRGDAPPARSTRSGAISFNSETIDEWDLKLQSEEIPLDFNKRYAIGKGLNFLQNPDAGPHSKLLVHEDSKTPGQPKVYFLFTKPGYTGETGEGIKIGSKQSDVELKYGPPKQIFETTNGQLMLYTDILFFIDSNKLVENWAIWLK